jgi:V-type H+-transporting ATPase subunit a
MKLSVILGVTHMVFGICLKGLNNIYFKQTIDFVFEFIPQIIFMTILFGYMVVMLFMKWSIDFTPKEIGTDTAPSIITILMNIFLKGGSLGEVMDKRSGKTITPLWGGPGEQENFHFIILIICGICVPLMLFPKPIITYLRAKKHDTGFDRLVEEVYNNIIYNYFNFISMEKKEKIIIIEYPINQKYMLIQKNLENYLFIKL